MKLSEYFEQTKGVGVLATADAAGKVNTAVYARPHFLDPSDDNMIAFIMGDRLSHANIQANPHASYLFIEETRGHVGKRLALIKTSEETDAKKIQALRRRNLPEDCEVEKTRFLVHFRIDAIRPLIGGE
jgi:hypothetical protein